MNTFTYFVWFKGNTDKSFVAASISNGEKTLFDKKSAKPWETRFDSASKLRLFRLDTLTLELLRGMK